jgi:hypothetical protein
MSNRSLLFLLLLLVAVFLAVKLDLPTKLKIGVTNWIYGDEMREIYGFRVSADISSPELEKEGLTREKLRERLTAALLKAGIKTLPDEEWRQTPGRPLFSFAIQAAKLKPGKYQYTITIDVTKSETRSAASVSEKRKLLWSVSAMGEDNIADILLKIDEITSVFLKARAGV